MTRGRTDARTRGFTLVEVLVALTVSAVVAVLAHRTLATAGELGAVVAERRVEHDRAMNARRFLAAALGSLDVGIRVGGFRGLADRAQFVTWLPTPEGPLASYQVTLAQADQGLFALLARRQAGEPSRADTLLLAPDVQALDLDYLLDFGAGAAWVREWQSPVSAPVAVRLRLTRRAAGADTLLFFVGSRG
jgi:prepilin-type N-terminal cleavage/methylation domain-containing protein